MAEQSRRFMSVSRQTYRQVYRRRKKQKHSFKDAKRLSLLSEFLNSKNERRRIEEIPPGELKEYISEFIVAVRKKMVNISSLPV